MLYITECTNFELLKSVTVTANDFTRVGMLPSQESCGDVSAPPHPAPTNMVPISAADEMSVLVTASENVPLVFFSSLQRRTAMQASKINARFIRFTLAIDFISRRSSRKYVDELAHRQIQAALLSTWCAIAKSDRVLDNRLRATPMTKKRDLFDSLLEEVLGGLPPEIARLLEEIPVIVDDEPPPGEPDLCGLHWGVPLPSKSIFDSGTPPEHILLFRGPIMRLAGTSKPELKRQIHITLLHEIGHHFGLDEKQLAALGYG